MAKIPKTSRRVIPEEACYEISLHDFGVLLGMCMGDCHLTPAKHGNSKMYIEHSASQLEYLTYKRDRVAEILKSEPMRIVHKRRKDGRESCFFMKSHPIFTHLRDILYPHGKQFLGTQEALDLIPPEGLAIFYMDDGSLTRPEGKPVKQITLYTCISERENKAIINWINQVTGALFKQYRLSKTGLYQMYATPRNLGRFLEIIDPYKIPCMEYKFRFW
jgi:hypothetical protein